MATLVELCIAATDITRSAAETLPQSLFHDLIDYHIEKQRKRPQLFHNELINVIWRIKYYLNMISGCSYDEYDEYENTDGYIVVVRNGLHCFHRKQIIKNITLWSV